MQTNPPANQHYFLTLLTDRILGLFGESYDCNGKYKSEFKLV